MRPREQLVGEKLDGGWTVTRMLQNKGGTGSNFSVGYLVENKDGRKGFLKAMDYLEALRQPNAMAAMRVMSDMYIFEKQICEACRDSHLGRIVHAIDSGYIMPDPANPGSRVEYLIFELAEQGNVRHTLDQNPDVAFMLGVLHNVGVGLKQLHNAEMAHQDTKPSNVLIFQKTQGAKLADLGRAWAKAFPAPHDGLDVAGDPSYAPPELLYRAVPTDPRTRRFGCDLYNFGNLVAFVFTRANINALLNKHLAAEHRSFRWAGSFTDVLPYLKTAFGASLAELEPQLPVWPREDLLEMICQLCEPDPTLRGHPSNRSGHQNQYSLDRYISKLNSLATRAELMLRKAS